MTASGGDAFLEDRSPSVSSFPSIYDTYLCNDVSNLSPLPESDSIDIYDKRLRILQSSAGYFVRQDRFRDVERLQLETARVYVQKEEWVNAIRVLKPLWQTLSWRQGGWWQLVQEVDWALRDCARKAGDWEILIAVEWELLSNCFTPYLNSHYDFSKCLEGLESPSTRPKAIVQVENVKSCLAFNFGFVTSRGNVGDKLLSQLVVSSRAHEMSAPIIADRIHVALRGSLQSIRIERGPETTPPFLRDEGLVQMYDVSLKQNHLPSKSSSLPVTTFEHSVNSLDGASDLEFPAGVTKVFLFETILREPGEIQVVSATMYIKVQGFDFEVTTTSSDHLRQRDIWIRSDEKLTRKRAVSDDSLAITVLPRPPKVRIHVENLQKTYFTDELIRLRIHITNNEAAQADVVLQGELLGQPETLLSLEWTLNGDAGQGLEQDIEGKTPRHVQASNISHGLLNTQEIKQAALSFQAGSEAVEYVLKIDVFYHLITDPETLISKTFETELVIERPFSLSYMLLPQVHPSPWPSYFSTDESESFDDLVEYVNIPRGLKQNWSLVTKIATPRAEAINVDDVSLQLLERPDDTLCRISQSMNASQDESDIKSPYTTGRHFDLELQKYRLDDSRPVKLSFQLQVEWRRQGTQTAPNISQIAVPELDIQFGEPRVLASAHPPQGNPACVQLEYTIENPSMYVLTFNLSMETSDEFAFSGAKATSIQLVPLSRHSIRYNIFPLVQGRWITPLFRAVDPYFNKTLKVQAAQDLRGDSEGLHIWIDAED